MVDWLKYYVISSETSGSSILECITIIYIRVIFSVSNSKKLLGRRISQMRKKCGLSQEKLAELLNIDPNSVSRIECGVHYPSLDTLEKISNILNVEMGDFFLNKNTDTVRDMRTFLIQAVLDAGEEKLDEVVRAVRKVG